MSVTPPERFEKVAAASTSDDQQEIEKTPFEFSAYKKQLSVSIATLSSQSQKIYHDFQQDWSLFLKNIREEVSQGKPTLSQLQVFLRRGAKQLIESYGKIAKIDMEYFSWTEEIVIPEQEEEREYQLEYLNVQTCSRFCSRLAYLEEVSKNIESVKEKVCQTFSGSSLDLQRVHFDIQPHSSETHMGGRVASRVTFYLDETSESCCGLSKENTTKELFSVYYKPRSAETDSTIIRAFQALNQLEAHCKSLDEPLPSYTILSFPPRQTTAFSIWEEVKGVKISYDEANTIEDYITMLDEGSSLQMALAKQLQRLDSVCNYLAVTDLHIENLVIGKQESTQAPLLVPIDLEVILPGSKTGLYTGLHDGCPLSPEEKEILDSYRESLHREVRFVPLATHIFRGGFYTPHDGGIKYFAESIIEKLESSGYQDIASTGEMIQVLTTDYLNGDIPYFIKKGDMLYHRGASQDSYMGRNRLE